jgi:hypothetical protein
MADPVVIGGDAERVKTLADVSPPSLATEAPAGAPRTGLRGLTQQAGRAKAAGRSCCETELRPLAVVNSVGEVAAEP